MCFLCEQPPCECVWVLAEALSFVWRLDRCRWTRWQPHTQWEQGSGIHWAHPMTATSMLWSMLQDTSRIGLLQVDISLQTSRCYVCLKGCSNSVVLLLFSILEMRGPYLQTLRFFLREQSFFRSASQKISILPVPNSCARTCYIS